MPVRKAYFAPEFEQDMVTYSHIRKQIKKKVDMVLAHPYELGEPLKYDLEGLRSVPVRKNYLLIYMIYKEWKTKGLAEIPGWLDLSDDTVVFLTIKPHDIAYQFTKDWMA